MVPKLRFLFKFGREVFFPVNFFLMENQYNVLNIYHPNTAFICQKLEHF